MTDCYREPIIRAGAVTVADVFAAQYRELLFVSVLADPALAASVQLANGQIIIVPPGTAFTMSEETARHFRNGMITIGATATAAVVIYR